MSAAWRPRGGRRPLLARLRDLVVVTPVPDTGDRRIDVAPWPERIDELGVAHFRDNGRPEYAAMRCGAEVRPDVLVLCTGYQQTFPFLQGSGLSPPWLGPPTASSSSAAVSDRKDKDKVQEEETEDNDNPMLREIWRRRDPTVAYIGFVRPNLGAIPPLAEMQAQLWVLRLLAPERIAAQSPSGTTMMTTPEQRLRPDDEPHYRLIRRGGRGARVRYGVDHESYAYQLALDTGSAPSLCGDVLPVVVSSAFSRSASGKRTWRWRLPLTWALGANFNTKFRLCGPWQWDSAVDVLEGELWDTVARREWFFGELYLSLPPIASLCANPMDKATSPSPSSR